MQTVLTREELNTFLEDHFQQVVGLMHVEHVGNAELTLRGRTIPDHLRPGGTVSGPAMFALADVGIYLNILSIIGLKALSVTTNASIDFMRKPVPDRDLIANCRVLKIGKSLAVGDALIYSEGQESPVARSSMTYSIPK